MDQYLVVGNPVAHSKSPDIHRLFAEQTSQALEYRAQLVEQGQFSGALEEFIAQGIKGLNVTVPFKGDAYNAVNQLSEGAKLAQAVNTISIDGNGQTRGDNTDGIGLMRDITVNQNRPLKGKRVLVLGAGGAVRGILAPLLEQQPTEVWIANRTASKAEALAQAFAERGRIGGGGWESVGSEAFDWIINGTAASLQGDLPPLPDSVIGDHTCCYDMMYSTDTTPFNQWAQQQGAELCVDGLGMLVEQAAEAFVIWRGVRPDTPPVIQTIRDALGQQ